MLEIKNDITFENEEGIIRASTAAQHLFLHPEIIQPEMKKVEKNCPFIYGDHTIKEQFIVMEHQQNPRNIKILNYNLEEVHFPKRIFANYKGKIIVLYNDSNNQKYTIMDNTGQILCDNMSLISSNPYFSIYKNNGFRLIISQEGYIHATKLNVELLSSGYFIEKEFIDGKSFYKLFDSECKVIYLSASYKKILEISKKKNVIAEGEENSIDNYYYSLHLYKEYLTLELNRLLNQKTHRTHKCNSLKEIADYSTNNNINLVVNLYKNTILNGTFKRCVQISDGTTNLWVDDISEIDQASEIYKRERKLKNNETI